MADIIPFKGTLYNPEKIKDTSKTVAPPYDVISPKEQDDFYNSHPQNIIRILLGKDLPSDNEKQNKYTRAAGFLKDWQKEDILKKDDTDALYIYLQEFKIEGQIKERLGFIALLRIEDFGTEEARTNVYPHEHTFSGPKDDRTKLITSIEANIGPIFALFADENKAIDAILSEETNAQPIIDIIDFHGIRNKLWRVSNKDKVETIVCLMKDKELFIADGHHRYEVGIAFSKTKKDPKYGYILTYFTDLYADGIVILPVHRLIKGISNDAVLALKKDLEKKFIIEELVSKEYAKNFLSGEGSKDKRFVMYTNKIWTGLRVKDNDSLDVNVLQDLVIGPLGEKISIDFTKDMDYAIKEVNSGKFSFCIFLNPTKITQVRDVAFAGKRMPQKSTYFYPKVLSGLVINVF